MCIPSPLQQKILDRTDEGDTIAAFLVDTMRGKTPGVKVCHRMDAAKHLIKYGFPDANCETTSDRLSRAGGNPEGQGSDETPAKSPLSDGEERVRSQEIAKPVTHLDIINYQIAHLIRHETAEGHTLVEFLIHIMTGRDRPFTPKKFRIKPADRIAAARELLRRGFGDIGPRRKQSDITDETNAYDTLHTDLARRMREYSERGTDTVRFLLEVMSDPDPELEFTIHHRMSAAQELLRRGWDTNHDNIKPKHLTDYWQDKESSRLSIGQKKTLSGFTTSIDDYDNYDAVDYETIARQLREDEDRDDNSKPLRFQETVPSSRHSSESRNLEDRQAASPSRKLPLLQGEGTDNSLPPRRGKARMGVKSPSQSPSNEDNASAVRHSRAGGNPEGRGEGEKSTDPFAPSQPKTLPQSESADDTISNSSNTDDKNIYDYNHNDPDPSVDYHYEPLNPEEQALFDYEARLESGDFPKGEVPKEPPNPPPSAYAEYSDTLRRIKDAAAREGVPVLPNPLAGKLHAVKIRSP